MALPVSDNFNRVENPLSNGTWETTHGSGLQADGATLKTTSTSTSASGWLASVDTFSASQYAEVVYTSFELFTWLGPALRMMQDTYYCFQSSVADNNRILKVIAGVETVLATSSTTVASGDTVRFEAIGSELTVFLNGTQFLQVTDSDIQTGQAGVAGKNGNTRLTLIDSWSAGNLTPPLQIISVPATVERGGSATINGVSFGATAGTVNFGGESVQVDSWSDESIVVSIPGAIQLPYAAGLYTFTVIAADSSSDTSVAVDFTPAAGRSYIDLVNPVWINSRYLLFGFTGTPDPVTGDQLEYDTVTSPSGILNLPEVDSEWVLISMPAINQTTTCNIIRAATGVRSASWTIEWVVGVTLQIQPSTQLQSSSNVTLIQQNILNILSSLQSSVSSNIDISSQNTLTIDASVQLQPSINIDLLQQSVLSISASTQDHASDNITLSEQAVLTIVKAAQDQSSSSLDLTQSHILTIDSSQQLQIAEIITLDVPSSAVGYLTAIITITPSMTAEIDTLPRS